MTFSSRRFLLHNQTADLRQRILRFFVFSWVFVFLCGCIIAPPTKISQALEDKVIPISEIVNLKCRLETGSRIEGKSIPFTNSKQFRLELKEKKGSYKEAREESVIYNYEAEDGEKKTGWINNFSYVTLGAVKGAGKKAAKNSINCHNLLSREHHPILRAKSGHPYEVRFQVRAGLVRVLLVAPPKDLPSDSLAYSIKINDTLYAMPIGGYKAIPVEKEALKNTNWEETNVETVKPLPIARQRGFKEFTLNGIPHSHHQGTDYVHFTDGVFKPYETLVENAKKRDVYPKNFFKGEWFYALTPVKGASKGGIGGAVLQHVLSLDYEGGKAQVVRFEFEENNLLAYNVNKEKSDKAHGKPGGTDLDRWVLQIPIKHKDYASVTVNRNLNAGLREGEKEPEENWWEKIHAQLELSKVIWPLTYKMFGKSSGGYAIEDLTVSSDYFSFLIEDENKNQTIRFSFLRRNKEDSSYKPLYVTDDKFNLFPAFYVSPRLRIEDRMLETEASQTRPVSLLNIREPVRYHFSDMTPESVRALGRESVNIWNQVFQKAEAPCPESGCFQLGEKDVPLGDIRYNVLHFTDPKESLDSFYMGGWGPSLTDYETGEVISTTTSVGTWLYYHFLIDYIEQYIKRKVGMSVPLRERGVRQLQSSDQSRLLDPGEGGLLIPDYLLAHLGQYAKKNFVRSFMDSGAVDSESGLLMLTARGFRKQWDPNMSEYMPVPIPSTALSPEERKQLLIRYNLAMGEDKDRLPENLSSVYEAIRQYEAESLHACDRQEQELMGGDLMGDRIYNLIDTLCELSPVNWLLAKNAKTLSPHRQVELWRDGMGLEKQDQENSPWEREIHECADKILPVYALETTLHEQGHNVAMRHNFAGSADRDNVLGNQEFEHKFIFSHLTQKEKDDVTALLSPYSSTVMDYNSDPFLSPGAYDVAFVRFYYGEKIEGVEGDIQTVDLASPYELDRDSFKTYRVCEDTKGRLKNGFGEDIFCAVFDRGSTATEIVENYYNRFIHLPSQVSLNQLQPWGGLRIVPFILKTRKIYHKWRTELANMLKMNKTDDPYHLKGIDEDDYTKQIHERVMTENCRSHPKKDVTWSPEAGSFVVRPSPPKEVADCLCQQASLESEESDKALRDLYCAKRKIADTSMGILFHTPDHYCIIRNTAGESELITFRDIHEELRQRSDVLKMVSSCYDIPEEAFEKAGWKLMGESGYPLYSGVFSTNINHVPRFDTSRVDYSGLLFERLMAGFNFIFRTRGLKGFPFPGVGLMDEPDIRYSVKSNLEARLTRGIYKKDLLSEKTLNELEEISKKLGETEPASQEELMTKLEDINRLKELKQMRKQVLDVDEEDIGRRTLKLFVEYTDEYGRPDDKEVLWDMLKERVWSQETYYKFNNEEFLWSLVSRTLLLSSIPPTELISVLQNKLSVMAQIRPMPLEWNRGNNAWKFYFSLYHRYKLGAYIFDGFPDPENSSSLIPFIIFPTTPVTDPLKFSTEDIIRSLEITDRTLNFKAFYEDLIEWREYKEKLGSVSELSEDPDFNEFVNFNAKPIYKDIVSPVSGLLELDGQEIPYQMAFVLTYSLLFDYLIDGEKLIQETDMNSTHSGRYYVTDHLVEVLQAGLWMRYRIQKEFNEKCDSEETCPRFHLPVRVGGAGSEKTELFDLFMSGNLNSSLNEDFTERVAKAMESMPPFTLSDYVTEIEGDSDEIKTFNLFRPFFKHLMESIESERAQLNQGGAPAGTLADPEFRQLLLTLLSLQSFKPGERENKKVVAKGVDLPCEFPPDYIRSEISRHLLEVLDEVSRYQKPEASCVRIGMVRDQTTVIRDRLKEIDTALIHFPNSRFLRDIFFMSLFDKDPLDKYVLKMIEHLVDFSNEVGILHEVSAPFDSRSDFTGSAQLYLPSAEDIFSDLTRTRIPNSYNIFSLFMDSIKGIKMAGIRGAITDAFPKTTRDPSFKGMLQTLFEVHKEKTSAFSNRISKEITAQRHILIRSFYPHLEFSRGLGGGGSSGSSAGYSKEIPGLSYEEAPEMFQGLGIRP